MNFPVNILSFIKDILLILVVWAFMAAAYFSWGSLFSKILTINISGNKGFFAKIWLGWVWGICFFSLYHLFLPINAFGSSAFFLPGIIYFFIKYGKKTPEKINNLGKANLVILFLIALTAATIAIQAPVNYDTGLYHLNSIRWANEYPIVKGLGNLHTRLGLNQLYFLYAASLNFHPYLNDYAFHAASSFLYILFAAGMLFNGTFIDLFLLCLFFYIPMPYYWIANPTPDIASTLLQIIAFRYFIDAVFFKPNDEGRVHTISFVAVLSAVLVTIKLSNVVLAFGFGFITLIFYLNNQAKIFEKKLLGKTFIFIGLFTALWLSRGYIQTGYPLFPSDKGSIKFDWTVPKRLANYTENCVYCGSRTNGQIYDPKSPILEDWAWLDFWIKWNFFDEKEYLSGECLSDIVTWMVLIFFPMIIFNWGMGSVTLFVLSLMLFILWLRAVFLHRDRGVFEKTKYLFLVQLVGLACILFWFFVAPEVRFANGSFIIYAVSNLLLVKGAYPKLSLRNEIKTSLKFFSIIMFIWAFYLGYSVDAFRIDGMNVMKKVPMKTFVTNSGLKLLVPTLSDQCWDSDLPSTPEPEAGLELRTDKIKEGFRIRE